MTKIRQYVRKNKKNVVKHSINRTENKAPLDTLAQLDHANIKELKTSQLKKRAKAKFFTNNLIYKLVDLKPQSPLIDSYWNTYHCAELLVQTDKKITSHYCNNRWCVVCSRIRTAKLINGYMTVIDKWHEPRFVTLTSKTISATKTELYNEVLRKNKLFSLIIRRAKRHFKRPIEALRKSETTIRPGSRFHPHLHILVEGDDIAKFIVSEWLKSNGELATDEAQNIKVVDSIGGQLEIFKYMAKIITNKRIYPHMLDLIFQAYRGLRTIQPYGIKKVVSEELDDLEAEIYEDITRNTTIWEWFEKDWIDKNTGECLTNYEPSDEILKVFNLLK